MLRAHVAELQDKSKAQAEQIDELHKRMAEQKMQAGSNLTVASNNAWAAISPPESTKSPKLTSSISWASMTR